jgi:hypothetical protein
MGAGFLATRYGARERSPLAPRDLFLLVLLAIVFAGLANHVTPFKRFQGHDFYHYWGVATAQRLSGYTLGSPYPHREEYARILNEFAETSTDPTLKATNAFRRELDLTGTPLLYAFFSFLPTDYAPALTSFNRAQIVSLWLATLLLGVLLRLNLFWMPPLAFLLALFYFPFTADLANGNLNSFQFLFVTLCGIGCNGAIHSTGRRSLLLASATTAALAVLFLLKPNVGLVCALLLVTLWLGLERMHFWTAVALGCGVSLLSLAFPCRYFDSWSVWLEWMAAFGARVGSRMEWSAEAGNYSFAHWVERRGRVPYQVSLLLLSASAALVFLAAAVTMVRGEDKVRRAWRRLTDLCRDPRCGCAVGNVATLYLTRLAWSHYYLMSLIPALWLVSRKRSCAVAPWLGVAAIVLSSGVLLTTAERVPFLCFLAIGCLLTGTVAVVASEANEQGDSAPNPRNTDETFGDSSEI